MGLDLQFAMEVEKVFHVDLADEEWLALRTLGDVHSNLRLRLPHFSGGTCASMVAHQDQQGQPEPP